MDMNRVTLLLKDEEETPRLSFKYLLTVDNNWLDLKKLHKDQLRPIEIQEVEKMLNCGSQENGFATYICPHCGRKKVIPFSCKSRICTRCGKRHADEWAEELNSELFDVTHRHIVLTITDKLWPYFEHNPSLQKLLMDTAAKAILRIIGQFNPKKEDITAGLVVVLHPFGSDLKANFHIHILATEGGLTKDNRWINMPYIDYTTIRKIWQYEILKALKRKLPNDPVLTSIIDWCYKNKVNGFTIFAKSRIQGKTKAAVRYVGRYVRHPAISNRRIIDYDGEYVTFSYKRDGKFYQRILRKFNFIRAVLKHIPEKHFKMVRYYGLYARNLKAKTHKIMQALKRFTKKVILRFSWRENKTRYTGSDPLLCEVCGTKMELYTITYRDRAGPGFKTIGGIDWVTQGEIPDYVVEEEKEERNRHQVYMPQLQC